MPGAQEVGADVLATPEQIAGGFLLRGRDVNRGERAGALAEGERRGIAAVGLDAVTRTSGNQRRRDHVAGHVVGREGAL
jgi:hypothetical protein